MATSALLGTPVSGRADVAVIAPFDTPVTLQNLDPAVFQTATDGVESSEGLPPSGPSHVLWTTTSHPEPYGVQFGAADSLQTHRLRLGFKAPVAVGSVLVLGGGKLSVLKATAAYPGNLGDDSQWIAATRIERGAVGTDEVRPDEYALWVLPPGTMTRALRFTHTPVATDSDYAGRLGGVWVLSGRYANVAPDAVATASSNTEHAGLINDEKAEVWNCWDNAPQADMAKTVSEAHPEYVFLSWPSAVELSGVGAVWAGFGSGDVQEYIGPEGRQPIDTTDADWRTISSFSGLQNGYPIDPWPNWIGFDHTIKTRALRVRIMSVTKESHPHLVGRTMNGARVWLGELLAMHSLGADALESAVMPKAAPLAAVHAPIPVHFHLSSAGYVTLVIEDAQHRRVRNLISDTEFPAGDNTVWWDGTDDLGRDLDAAHHGLYHIPAEFVAPGTYTVRGLVHPQVDLRYQFCVYAAGTPPWQIADGTGGWLTTHTPAQSALYVPATQSPAGKSLVYFGCYVAEGGSGLAWTDLDGKKQGGRGWVGGNWTAAPFLARDAGPTPVAGDYAYVASGWKTDDAKPSTTEGIVRITALSASGDRKISDYPYALNNPATSAVTGGSHDYDKDVGGIAVYNGTLAVSLTNLSQIVFFDAHDGKVLGSASIADPRGLVFDSHGGLYLLSGTNLVHARVDLGQASNILSPPSVVYKGLQDPHGITLDAKGAVYVSDWGDSQQVKIITPAGALAGVIGQPGAPRLGAYNPFHMNHPFGITIDSNDHLWVAEADFQPKRVSEWTLAGNLLKSIYGPPRYGGGGTLDPRDKNLFYYEGMAFKADWQTGECAPESIFWRDDIDDVEWPGGDPETPLYAQNRKYLTNCYDSYPTNGAPLATLFRMQDGIAVPCAAMGRANDWPLLKTDAFKQTWPAKVDLNGDIWKGNQAFFVWSDLNGDGKVEPNEVTMVASDCGGVTVMPDLSFAVARVGSSATRFVPARFTTAGVPVYDIAGGHAVSDQAQPPASDGGDQMLTSPDGWTVLTTAPKPYASEGLGGLKNGEPVWSYPSLWPGLHPSHEAPIPTFPGELIGATRLLGGLFTPLKGEAGPLFAINGNMGDMYVFTEDGLFVTQLFQDVRVGKSWSMPTATQGMLLNDISCHDENFFPTLTELQDGDIYLSNGAHTAIVKVDGLDQIQRLPASTLSVSQKDLQAAQAYFVQSEAARQKELGTGILTVALRSTPPVVDGNLDDWAGADWVTIDRRGTAANFNSNSKPYDVTAAVAVSGDKLYAAWRTNDPNLLSNSGQEPTAPFKTGGALDLMLNAIPGGERLIITKKDGKTFAVLYRAHVPGTPNPIPFSSPWRTITIDRVEDVSSQVQLAGDAQGDYEISVPLSLLSLNPQAGQTTTGDIGILRGNGFQTLQRVYWSNKATAIVSDVPSEAELTPSLWGQWVFK